MHLTDEILPIPTADHHDPKYDEYSWEWLDRRIVLEYRAKVAYHWANLAVDTQDKANIQDAILYLEDVLKYEEIAHGHESTNYILADLHNALGMLWVHMQHYVEKVMQIFPCFSGTGCLSIAQSHLLSHIVCVDGLFKVN